MRQFLIHRLRSIRWAVALAALLALLLSSGWDGGVAPNRDTPQTQTQNTTALLQAPGIKAPLWTATKSMTAEQNARAHFKKHGAEMGFTNAEDYVREAQKFLRDPPKGTETKIEHDGDILRYHESSGRFGVMRRDGAPRTFFIPDPDPGASSNRGYFDRQD